MPDRTLHGFRADRPFRTLYRQFDGRPWEEWSLDDVARIRPQVQAALAGSRPHTIFCKTHLAVLKVRDHPTINMNVTAGAIYLVRNPLDVAISYANHQGLPLDRLIELHQTPSLEPRRATRSPSCV